MKQWYENMNTYSNTVQHKYNLMHEIGTHVIQIQSTTSKSPILQIKFVCSACTIHMKLWYAAHSTE